MAADDGSLLGAVLGGRYRIKAHLGAGGMGGVYLAEDESERLRGRTVVVKLPLAALMDRPSIRARFLDEIRSLARTQHPNVVKILDAGEHDGRPFCIVEFLDGGSLADVLTERGGQLEPEEVLEWLPTIARALDFVHRAGMVHRDVKPANLLFDKDHNAYLSDFGIATLMEADPEDDTVVGQLTIEGAFVGAPAYAPPEAVHRELSGAYDQYSLAIVVYTALAGAGKLPFEGKTAEAFLVNKASKDPAALDEVVEGVPNGCVSAVMRGLERDANKRWPTCAAFAEAFERGLHETPPMKPPTGSSPTRWLFAVTGVAAAVLAALLLWPDSPGEDPGPGRLEEKPAPSSSGEGREAESEPEVPVVAASFRAGSTEAEIDAAVALCEQFYRDAGKPPTCPREWWSTEQIHEIAIPSIDADRTEVTNREFAAFANATGHVTSAERGGESFDGPISTAGLSWRSALAAGDAQLDRAVVHVSRSDARAFCEWRKGRLPSAEEWEFIARGTERRVFPWGNDWDPERASWRVQQEVGKRPGGATPEGHLDMAGGVWEWTASDFEGEAVLKGGSWFEPNPANLRAAAHLLVQEDEYSGSDSGFRCIRER